jgi:hypothetical protein
MTYTLYMHVYAMCSQLASEVHIGFKQWVHIQRPEPPAGSGKGLRRMVRYFRSQCSANFLSGTHESRYTSGIACATLAYFCFKAMCRAIRVLHMDQGHRIDKHHKTLAEHPPECAVVRTGCIALTACTQDNGGRLGYGGCFEISPKRLLTC